MDVKILLDKRKVKQHKDGTFPVVLHVFISRTERYWRGVGSEYHCMVEQWDDVGNRFNAFFPNYKVHNLVLDEKEKVAKKIIAEYALSQKPFNIEAFMMGYAGVKSVITLTQAFDIYIARLLQQKKVGNSMVFTSARNAFQTFDEKAKLAAVTPQFIQRFEEWQRENGNTDVTIINYIGTLRSMLNKAIKDQLFDFQNYPFGASRQGEPKYSMAHLKTETRPRAITDDLTEKMKELYIPHLDNPLQMKNNLRLALDMYLFSYYAFGINFTDMAHLTKKNLVGGRIDYERAKTHQFLSTGIRPEAQAIIDFYVPLSKNAYLFPILNDAVYITPMQRKNRIKTALKGVNHGLKQICKMIGGGHIKLTSYVARHTVAKKLSDADVSTKDIADVLGHTDLKSVQFYLGKLQNDKSDKHLGKL